MIDITNNAELRKIIIQHYTKPTLKGLKNVANSIIKVADSTTCADKLTIELIFKDTKIFSANFDGSACAIATSSADIFLSLIIGLTLQQANEFIEIYKEFLQTGTLVNADKLQDLVVFKNIYKQKNRIICAELCTKVFNQL